MAVGLFFLIILGIFGAVFGGIAIAAWRSDTNRGVLRSTKQQLTSANARARVAERALRSINNGAARPDLEAQIALDEIETLRTKELN